MAYLVVIPTKTLNCPSVNNLWSCYVWCQREVVCFADNIYFTKCSSCFLPSLQPILSVANRECNFLVLRWFDAITDVSVLHSSVDVLHPCTVLGDIISRHLQKPCIDHVCIFKGAFRKQEHKSGIIMNYSMSRQKAQCGDPRKTL